MIVIIIFNILVLSPLVGDEWGWMTPGTPIMSMLEYVMHPYIPDLVDLHRTD